MLYAMHPPHKFDLKHFKRNEAMGFNVIASKSPTIASVPYNLSSKSLN
jgi:hypothetical protein